MADRYKEKTRDGQETKELDCPEGYRGQDGKCVKMTAKEMRNRSDAAHKTKRNHGNKQKYIDKKRNDTIEKNEVNEMSATLNKKVKKELDVYFKGSSGADPDTHHALKHILMGALTDANFHKESKKAEAMFPKAKKAKHYGNREWEENLESHGEDIAKLAKWDGHDILDAIGFWASFFIGRPVGEKIENLKEGLIMNINERTLSPLQIAYADFFTGMLDEYEVTSPAKLSKDKKSEFFNRIKKEWPKAKRKVTQESVLRTIIREEIQKLDEETFFQTSAGRTLKSRFKGKFNRAMFQKLVQYNLDLPYNQMIKSIKHFCKVLGLDWKKYITDFIEEEDFMRDATKAAEQQYKSLGESIINESKPVKGKKSFYQMDNIGKSKYTVNAYDGKATHKDGSPFYDIAIFKNKDELAKYKADLFKKGYTEE